MIYLASPYSHEDPTVEAARYQFAQAFVAKSFPKVFYYSPIVYFHPLALRYAMPRDAAHYRAHNEHMLSLSDELHVLTLHEWEKSVGVREEISWAAAREIPIIYVRP